MDLKFELTNEQKVQFYTDGYIILKDVVDKKYLKLAKRKINQFLGTGKYIFIYHKIKPNISNI